MVTIPLGLGTRWQKMPVVTLALTVLLTLLFLFERGQERSMKRTVELLSDPQYRLAKENIFLEYCRSKEKVEVCAEILPSIAPDFTKIEKKPKPNAKSKKTAEPSKIVDQKKKLKPDFRKVVAYKLHLQNVFNKFEREITKPSKALKALKAYPAFALAKRKFQTQVRAKAKIEHVLTKDNLTLESLFFGQIRHGGWSHLFGNLLCLIPFGIYVELRMGALRYLLAYLLAGTVGLAFNATFFLPQDLPLLGASANIAGVMGLFYVLFFHAQTQFFLWFGLSRRLGVPVKYALPVMFFIADVTGAVQSLVPGTGSGGVAHFAHLGGLVTGIAIGWLLRKIEPLPAPIIYPSELVELKTMQAIPRLDHKIHAAEQALLINPGNSFIRSLALEAILRQPASLLTNKQNQAHAFLFANLDRYCIESLSQKQYAQAYRMVAAIPLPVPLALYLGTLGQADHLMIAEFAVAERNHYLALRLYDAYLQRWRSTLKTATIRQSVLEILKALPDTADLGVAVQTYRAAVPQTLLAKEFDQKIAWIQHELDRMNAKEDEHEPNRAG